MYAENIGFAEGKAYDVGRSESESVKMLSAAAKETGAWLIGGLFVSAELYCKRLILGLGSIPEREAATDHVFNTCTVYDPEGRI